MPDTRAKLVASFLADTPAAGAARRMLAGDASPRRYDRLVAVDGTSFVLMDAPPGSGQDVRPFVKIDRWLSDAGFSAPQVMAQDPAAGLLLLEDLGDDLYADLVVRDPACEAEIYATAVDVLAALGRQAPPPAVATYDAGMMAELAALSYRWYRLEVAGRAEPASAGFRATFPAVLAAQAGPPDTLALRDYHAQNLIWLPDRSGLARVGLLDFQDALMAPAIYDLASLLRDARRDVPKALAEAMIERFTAATGRDVAAARAAFATLSVQRNLRILGVFARLSLHFGKTQYIDLIPRVWQHLLTDLDHPALGLVRDMVLSHLPEPGPAHIQELKDRCGTIPTR